MNFDNLKYGFLISMTTMFGGSTLELYAQDENGGKAKIENTETYRQQFLESIAPDKRDISVEFVVDSVAQKLLTETWSLMSTLFSCWPILIRTATNIRAIWQAATLSRTKCGTASA